MKKINIKENPISLYLVIETVLFLILVVIGTIKYSNSNLNHLIIYMSIAVFLSLSLLIKNKFLDTKSKILDYIFVPIILISMIYSILPFI